MRFRAVGLRDRGRQTGRFNWVHLCLFTMFYRVSNRGEISTVMWEKRDQLLTGEDKSGPCESQITQQVAFFNSLLDWEVWNWAFWSRRGEANDLGSVHSGLRIRKWEGRWHLWSLFSRSVLSDPLWPRGLQHTRLSLFHPIHSTVPCGMGLLPHFTSKEPEGHKG